MTRSSCTSAERHGGLIPPGPTEVRLVKTLERLTYPGGRPNPDCGSYAWLRRELRKDAPDVERPDVRASNPAAMRQQPFQPTPHRQITVVTSDPGDMRLVTGDKKIVLVGI